MKVDDLAKIDMTKVDAAKNNPPSGRISVHTKMDKIDYRNFLLEDAFKINLVLTILLHLFLAAVCTLALCRTGTVRSGAGAAICLAICLGAFLSVKVFKILLQARIRERSDELGQFETYQNLDFGKEDIRVTVQGKEKQVVIPYKSLIRVAETSGYYYLYATRRMAAIVSKKDMDTASQEVLTALLRKVMSPYYIYKK